jgi:cyclic pyranopterin phosphate synthase
MMAATCWLSRERVTRNPAWGTLALNPVSPAFPIDAFQRPLTSLRLSVTDRCNLRCAYCMPEEEYAWLPDPSILTFEELSVVVDEFVTQGVRRVRLTGGEPLVRRELPRLVSILASKPLDEVALTTNGVLLAEHAQSLRDAGLTRLTVSLDTLSPSRFRALTRRDQHARVLEGIAAARRAGLGEGLKLDTVLMKGFNDDEVISLLDFAGNAGAELRFIEYMDVGGATGWSMAKVVSRAELLERLTQVLGRLEPLPGRGAAPAERFRLSDGRVFGIIASTTAPFCGACDRARLTADGHLLTCLYATSGLDLRGPLRRGEALAPLIASTWSRRTNRGAEERVALRERGPLADAEQLKRQPHLEMHTRGG